MTKEKVLLLRTSQVSSKALMPAPVSVSIGLAAMCDARDSKPADLLRAADLALYDAKHGGRNQVRERALECCAMADAAAF